MDKHTTMFLSQIIEYKRKAIDEKKSRYPLSKIMKQLETLEVRRRDFKKALLSHHGVNIIAEIKKASPSAGIIVENFDPIQIARIYESAEACAISILTESYFFKGKLSFLKTIRQVTGRPLLRKDFIVDAYQLYQTALLGADAVLLIASLLSENELRDFIRILNTYAIEALVEVHNEGDLHKALDAGSVIVGINNRDLHTFNVDLEITPRLIRHVPKGKVVVSESGIKTYEDIQSLRSIGVHAFLIGETLVKSGDIIAKMNELRGVTK